MTVTKGSSSGGRMAVSSGYERVVFDWTTDPGGTATDSFDMAGEIREIITVPGTAGACAIRLRDTADSDIDYLCGALTVVGSDSVEYWQPYISDSHDYRAPIVAGLVEFHVSDMAGTSDVTGQTILFLKT